MRPDFCGPLVNGLMGFHCNYHINRGLGLLSGRLSAQDIESMDLVQ